nr:hypothetical protein [Tanacetum cinerariifolium]
MSTQQDIYAAGFENRPPMLNKENYVSWSSRLLCYAKSRPNRKLIYNSIMNGPYVIRMILEPDIYAAGDSCKTAQKIWLHVQQIMKGSDIGTQDKKVKLFNEWKMFTSTNGESIESYYHSSSKLMNDFKRNKHFPERLPTISNELRAERLGKTHDPLALMANSNNPFNYPVFHQDQPSSSTYIQQPQPNNYNPQPSFNQNYMQIAKAFKLNYSTPTNNNQRISSNPRNRQIAQPEWAYFFREIANQNPNRNGNVVAAQAEGNANKNNGNLIRCYNCRGLGHLAGNCKVRPKRRDAAYLQTQLLIAQKEARI